VLLGGTPVQKAHQAVRVGDHLTLRLGRVERRLEVLALGRRRGPASEARALYTETAPPIPLSDREETWSPLLAVEDGEP